MGEEERKFPSLDDIFFSMGCHIGHIGRTGGVTLPRLVLEWLMGGASTRHGVHEYLSTCRPPLLALSRHTSGLLGVFTSYL